MTRLLLLLPLFLFANTPTSTHLKIFYDAALRQSKHAVQGTPSDYGFAAQNFILWDYSEGTPQQSYMTHYKELFAFVVEENISKVILFPKNPDYNPFFQLANQDITNDDNFAFFLNLFAKKNIIIEILFDYDAFNDSVSSTPTYALPNNFYFQDLPQKINWLVALMNKVPNAISGVTIDPEASGSGGNDGYQQVINYIDQYRFTLGPSNLQIGMTLGIDAKPMTFANLDTFPIDPLYINSGTGSPSAYFPFTIPSYRNGNTNPLLNHVYLQAYEPDFSLIFTENLDPSTAADTFIQALQDIPYKTSYGTISTTQTSLTGTYTDGGQFVSQGTITCTAGQTLCSYAGSQFSQEIVVGSYLDYNNSGTIVPIGQVHSINATAKTFVLADTTNGANITVNGEQFILSQFGEEILSGATLNTLSNTKIGAVDSIIPWNVTGYNPALHKFLFDTGATVTLSNQKFLGPEVVMKWTYPPITPAIAAGITFLFSVQYDATAGGNLFFGNWTLENYMAFVQRFLSQVSGSNPSNPIFNGAGLPEKNIGIYDYYLLLLTNANPLQNTTPPAEPNTPPSPPNPWFPEF